MEPLLEQLKQLPKRWEAMGRGSRIAALGALVLLAAIGGVAWLVSGGAESYQYAFTNLSPEDGAAASTALKGAGIPFRVEAGGTALAVPAGKVYDARMMLAAQGLPKAGGVGFELFDKGQFGVSEFTQKVNLRRAIEGELGRTVGNLNEVRAARVHLSLGERGLYRDEDKKATASVVVTLQPGRTLSDGQLSGIRHLVASAVPGLSPDAVTVMDGHGAVLGEAAGGAQSGQAFEAQTEAQLQLRVVSLLEPVVGAGAVLARINVSADSSEVSQNSEVFDPDQVALRTEKKQSANSSSDQNSNGGVAGAAANQPLNAVALNNNGTGSANKNTSGSSDEVRSFEISKTQTTTVVRAPRLRKLSVAVLLDQPKAGPRSEDELTRLGELAKRAVGFDEARGDQFQISQASFAKADVPEPTPEESGPPKLPWYAPYAGGALGLLIVFIAGIVLLRGGKKGKRKAELVLKPGMRVAELEAQANGMAMVNGVNINGAALDGPAGALAAGGNGKTAAELARGGNGAVAALPPPSPEATMREKAIELAKADPVKTAQLIRAWINADMEAAKEARRG